MRRPQTKTPFAYHHTATRKRGRPVHRLYAATPRPEMTGQALYFLSAPTGVGTSEILCVTFNGTTWYSHTNFFDFRWAAFKAAPETGRYWNANLWHVHFTDEGSWPGMFNVVGVWIRGLAIGACPYTADDSFVF